MRFLRNSKGVQGEKPKRLPRLGSHGSRTRQDRLDNPAEQTVTIESFINPTPKNDERQSNEALGGFPIDAMRLTRHSPEKIPGSTLDSKSSFRDGL